MNAIVGFSDLLTDEQLAVEERRDFIAQINQGADDLMRLIDDIIDTAGSMTKAAQLMVDNGANSVRAFCTHPVFSG